MKNLPSVVLSIATHVVGVVVSPLCAAPTPAPAEIEGSISAIKAGADGGVTMTVLGITVVVPKGVPVTSPSALLTAAQLADSTPLPGRTQPGFVGGTAIVNGTTDSESGVVTASDVFVEPAKHLVLGVITSKPGSGPAQVNNMAVVFPKDSRMPAGPPKNTFGFEVRPDSVTLGTPVMIEGYWDGKNFQAFSMEVRGKATLASLNPQVAILRSQSRENTPNNERGDDVELRGAVTMLHTSPSVKTQTLRIYRVDKGTDTALGDAVANRDADAPDYAVFTFRVTTPPSSDPVLGSAPTRFRIVNISAAAVEADTSELLR